MLDKIITIAVVILLAIGCYICREVAEEFNDNFKDFDK